jgi:predicted nucleic acid-binding protein
VKAVIDTNVVAYLLLGTKAFVDESRACFERVVTPLAPAHWEAELTSVLWMAVRAGVLPAAEGPVRLGLARRLGVESVATATLCQGALLRAIESGVSVYDTLFVELAARSRCRLLTFDKAVLKAFPGIARRPRDLPGR